MNFHYIRLILIKIHELISALMIVYTESRLFKQHHSSALKILLN